MLYKILTRRESGAWREAWDECLNESRYASHYVSPSYLEEVYVRNSDPFAVIAHDGPVVHGVLTGNISGQTLQSGAEYAPQICLRRGTDEIGAGAQLASGLLHHARGRAQRVLLHTWSAMPVLKAHGFSEMNHSVSGTIILDLTLGPETLMKKMSQTRRNQIRQAIRAGVVVSELDLEADFDSYYEIYTDWCDFKGNTPVPRDMQRAALSRQDYRLTLVARHEGRVVGVSIFRFRNKGLVEYAANVSRREDTHLYQNDLLVWRAIEWACARGCFADFSMGGAHYYLTKFGGQLHKTSRYSRDFTIFRRHHANELGRSLARDVYAKLPDPLRKGIKKVITRSG